MIIMVCDWCGKCEEIGHGKGNLNQWDIKTFQREEYHFCKHSNPDCLMQWMKAKTLEQVEWDEVP